MVCIWRCLPFSTDIVQGGDFLCDDCTQCVNDEFALTRKLGQTQANSVFAQHWSTFITQDDVNLMTQYGLNSVCYLPLANGSRLISMYAQVRIPIGSHCVRPRLPASTDRFYFGRLLDHRSVGTVAARRGDQLTCYRIDRPQLGDVPPRRPRPPRALSAPAHEPCH